MSDKLTRERVAVAVERVSSVLDAEAAIRGSQDAEALGLAPHIRAEKAYALAEHLGTLLAAARYLLDQQPADYESRRARAEGEANRRGLREMWSWFVDVHLAGQAFAEARLLLPREGREEGRDDG
jgi:hypothetical protein